jgi:hypothetical protein
MLALVSSIGMLTRLSLAGGGSSVLACGGSSNINVSAIRAGIRCQRRFRYLPTPPRPDRRCSYSRERHCTEHICRANQRPFMSAVTRRSVLLLLVTCPGLTSTARSMQAALSNSSQRLRSSASRTISSSTTRTLRSTTSPKELSAFSTCAARTPFLAMEDLLRSSAILGFPPSSGLRMQTRIVRDLFRLPALSRVLEMASIWIS